MKCFACGTEPNGEPWTCECGGTRLPPVRSEPLAPALQRVWDDLACMCREGGYASINVASITRRNAIIAVDEILRAGARLDGQKEAE